MSFDDYDDEEYEYQQNKEQMSKLLRHQKRFEAEQKQAEIAQVANQVWQESLKEAGLTQEQFQYLLDKNPDVGKSMYKQHVKEWVGKVSSRPRNADGTFKKMSDSQKKEHRESTASQMGLGRRHEGNRFDKDNRRGTDEEVHDMVRDMLGNDPIFKM